MTNGQKCHSAIVQVLATLELDIEQKAKLAKAIKSNGTYEPLNLMEDLLDINEMLFNEDVNGLLSRLKIYPAADKARDVIFYLDGEECDVQTFLDADNILGVREIRGEAAPSTTSNSVWEGIRAGVGSKVRNSVLKNSTSGSGRQGGEFSTDHERM